LKADESIRCCDDLYITSIEVDLALGMLGPYQRLKGEGQESVSNTTLFFLHNSDQKVHIHIGVPIFG
jgi:hypothetical protein